MLNKVLLIGNLTRDVEVRYTQSGLQIGSFGLAVNRRWKDRNSGESREDTMFIDVDVFGAQAETARQYIGKGRQVLVEGRLVLDQWTDQNGQKRSKHKISAENVQFLGSRGEGGDRSGDYGGGYDRNASGGSYGGGGNSYGGNPAPRDNSRSESYGGSKTPKLPDIQADDEEVPF
ncbi:MAG: single-stranded DNA-binding protein [Helicobacteraceae bacterium]|jgi:single-strand DNA-binding protein|nr:single-stranded DNA-binding protein [Helicobacteraceae bacterium]